MGSHDGRILVGNQSFHNEGKMDLIHNGKRVYKLDTWLEFDEDLVVVPDE